MAQDEDDTHDRLHQLTDLAPASQALGETRQRQVEGGPAPRRSYSTNE
ncbi:hypothetical protein [Streptomyces sp. NPDC051577]